MNRFLTWLDHRPALVIAAVLLFAIGCAGVAEWIADADNREVQAAIEADALTHPRGEPLEKIVPSKASY